MRFAIYPYQSYSNSAKVLSQALGARRIKHIGSRFRKWNNPNWWIINLGASQCPSGASVLNSSLNVRVASNKLTYFNLIKGHANLPDYTTDINIARSWFETSKTVVCRTLLNGHSGAGIVMADSPDQLVYAPLYTKYVAKDSEYRLHFAFDHNIPIFWQKKVRRKATLDIVDNRIRSVKTGWVYANDNIVLPECVLEEGRKAFSASHLDFGCVDVLYRKKYERATILEFNSCPGMTGKTLEAYKNAFLSLHLQKKKNRI